MHPIDELFTPKLRMYGGDGVRVIREAGVVVVPSGKLVIADPVGLPDGPPTIAVRPGSYPAMLALVRMYGGYECAAVRIDLSRGPVSAWRRTPQVIGVDSASACVADAGVVEHLRSLEKPADTTVDIAEAVGDAKYKSKAFRIGRSGAGKNLVAFRVHDDGGYPLWQGRAKSGKVVALCVPWARTGLDSAQHRRLFPPASELQRSQGGEEGV